MKYKIVERNQHGRDFVLGDLHGNYSYLKKLLQKVGFHQETDRLFLVGDLMDRKVKSAYSCCLNHGFLQYLGIMNTCSCRWFITISLI